MHLLINSLLLTHQHYKTTSFFIHTLLYNSFKIVQDAKPYTTKEERPRYHVVSQTVVADHHYQFNHSNIVVVAKGKSTLPSKQ